MTTACARIREHLGAYVDGELGPSDRLVVSQHVSACSSCADEQLRIRQVGEALRSGAAALPSHTINLQGLASGIISRTRAEDAQSWRALFDRASEDWHWALVGVGSLVAAAASVLLVAGICALGPRLDAEESLAAALNNLRMPADKLFIIATPAGADQLPLLLPFDTGQAAEPAEPAAPPAGPSTSTDSELTFALSQTVVGPDGRLSDLRSMPATRREHAEALFDEIQRRSAAPLASWPARRAISQKLGFVTNTNVSGKAL